MQVEIRKTDNRPEITIVRDDGVTLVLRPPDRKFPLPHDVVHFVVEQSLGLDHGFWGTLAAGAIFPSVKKIHGRQRPHAKEISAALLKSNAAALNEAEVIAGAFQHAMLETPKTYRPFVHRRLKGTCVEIDDEAIECVWTAQTALRQRWQKLEIGESVRLSWDGAGKSGSLGR